jgi:hypothetical protein
MRDQQVVLPVGAIPQLTSVSQHSDTVTRSRSGRTMSCNPFDLPVGSGHRRVHSFVPQTSVPVPLTPYSHRSNGRYQPQASVTANPISSPYYASSMRRDLSPKPCSPNNNNNNSNNNNNNNMQHHRPRVSVVVEKDGDDLSVISPLECRSIRPDPHYDPAKDPMILNRPFIPPLEITVKALVRIPDWLRMDAVEQESSSNNNNNNNNNMMMMIPSLGGSPKPSIAARQKSNHTARTEAGSTSYVTANGKPVVVVLSPRRHVRKPSNTMSISIGSIVGQSSLHTSPTEDSSLDDSGARLCVPERKSLMRTEFKHFVSKMPLFHYSKKDVNLQRARGCLT